MKLFKKILFILLNILVPLLTIAQNSPSGVLKLNINNIYYTNSVAQVFVDTAQSVNIDQIEKIKDFIPYKNFNNTFSTNYNYWVKFKVINESKTISEWILFLNNAPETDIFIKNKNSHFEHKKAGFLQENIDYKISFYLPAVSEINLSAKHDTFDIYICYKKIQHNKFHLAPNIYTKKDYEKISGEENFSQGIFQGILLIMILYHLLIFISVREKSYVHYVLYLFSLMIVFLIPFNYLWFLMIGKWVKAGAYLALIVQVIPAVFYLQFMQSLIQTKKKLPKWNKIINILKYSTFISSVLSIINFETTHYLYDSFLFVNINILIILLFGLIILFPIYKIPDIVAKFFVTGTLLLFIFSITGLFLLIQVLANHSAQYIIQFGIVSQILAFAIGLGKKMQHTEKEKSIAQEKLIVQLRENEALQTKVNRELEQRVKERTLQIELQKEEIETQRDQLEEKNAVLEQKNHEIFVQNELIERKNKNITDSIQYAKRIQLAVLPQNTNIKQFIDDYFIFFRPCQIVSGDFYFTKKVNNHIIIAAADCTGHGVPGAFMSMLGIAILNDIVRNLEENSAAEILNGYRIEIKNALQQKGILGEQQDGMDIAFCKIDIRSLEMQFAGANNPLYLIKNNQITKTNASLTIYNSDKMPIGIYPKEKPFTNHLIKLERGDIFYIFSDGYYSQFGGSSGEKLKRNRFQEILLVNFRNPMQEQLQNIETNFDVWRGKWEQVDDILVIGVKI